MGSCTCQFHGVFLQIVYSISYLQWCSFGANNTQWVPRWIYSSRTLRRDWPKLSIKSALLISASRRYGASLPLNKIYLSLILSFETRQSLRYYQLELFLSKGRAENRGRYWGAAKAKVRKAQNSFRWLAWFLQIYYSLANLEGKYTCADYHFHLEIS